MGEPADNIVYEEPADDAVNGTFELAEEPSGPADVSPSDSLDAAQNQSGLTQSSAPEADKQETHLNGHAAESFHLQNGHASSNDPEEASAEPASGQQHEPQEEPWKKRLYFVRMPKIPEENQYASKALQEEIDVYRSQVQLLNESMNIVRMQRDTAKENVAEARQNFNAATDAFKAKQDEVEPLQKGRKDQNDLQRNVQAEFRDLEVRSEQELDAKIREMEYHMAHESIPITQERQMVKHIKKLRDQRLRVRQYEEMYAGVETARAAVRSGQGELREMLQERQVLFEDKQLQQTIFNKHRDELRSLDEKINEIRDERSRVKEMQDGAYHRLQAIKQQSRGKKDAYYQNRRFSQDVRKMIRDGKLDEARQLCEEQTGAALGHLQADPDWRKEYLELWMHQRAPPFRITFDDYDFDEVPNGQQDASGKGKGHKANGIGPTAAAAPVLTAKERAQAIIDASFKEVKQDLARKANAGAASETVPRSEPSLSAPAPVLPSERKAESRLPSEQKAESKPPKPSKPAAKPAKALKQPPAAFQTHEPFVAPAAVSKVESAPKDKAAEAEAAAAAAREAQVRAQEGQRRKEKAAERKQKANQKRKAREAELKAQEAAAKAEAAAQQQKSQSETSADSDSSQTLASASASDRAATATSALSSAAAAASDRVPAAVKETPKKVLNQAAKKSEGLKRKLEAPKAKKVQRKKNWQAYARQVSRSVVQWGKAYPAQLGLIGIAMLMTLMVFALLNRNSTSNAQRGASLAS